MTTDYLRTLSPNGSHLMSQLLDDLNAPAACVTPPDEALIVKLVEKLYESARNPCPRLILLCGSPMSMGIALTRLHRAVYNRDSSFFQAMTALPPLGDILQEDMKQFDGGGSVWDDTIQIYRACEKHCTRAPYPGKTQNLDRIESSLNDRLKLKGFNDAYNTCFIPTLGAVSPGDRRIEHGDRRSLMERKNASVMNWLRSAVGSDVFTRFRRNEIVNLQLMADYLTFLHRLCSNYDVSVHIKHLDALRELSRHVGWIAACEEICLVCAPATEAHFNAEGVLHSEKGPALAYPDGFTMHALDGVPVPGFVVDDPKRITPYMIECERNATRRRILTQRYTGNYYDDCGAKLSAEDRFGRLYRKRRAMDSDLVFVRVTNSTPEPDGSFREYVLRVPPEIEAPLQAIAWTFDMTPEEYLKTQKMT